MKTIYTTILLAFLLTSAYGQATLPYSQGFEQPFTQGHNVTLIDNWWASISAADTLFQETSYVHSGSGALAMIPFGEETFIYAQVYLDLTGKSNVSTTFWAATESTGGSKSVRLFLTLSIDGGVTWTPNVEIGSHDTFPNETTPFAQYSYAFNPIAFNQPNVIMRFACRPGIMAEPAAKLVIDDVAIVDNVADVFKPKVLEPALLAPDSIRFIFSEPVSEVTAENVANYLFSPAIVVSSATLVPTQDTVFVKLGASLQEGITYALTLSGIQDLAGNIMDPAEFELTYNPVFEGLVITEIMFDPPPVGQMDNLEFIEIYNATCLPVNMGGLQLKEAIFSGKLPAYTLQPGQYYVMTKNASTFQAVFGYAANYQWMASNLENTSDLLLLQPAIEHAAFYLDSVRYEIVAPWPTDAAGTGRSIELKNAFLDNIQGSNWQSSTVAAGMLNSYPIYATPGKAYDNLLKPTVNLGPDGNRCGITQLTLDAGNPGSKYLWSTGEETQTILITASGDYSVVVNNGIGAATDAIHVTFVPAITAAATIPSTSCALTSVTFTDTSNDAVSWSWKFGDGAVSTSQHPVHTYSTPGTYQVSLTAMNAFGCSDTLTVSMEVFANAMSWTLPSACETVQATFTENTTTSESWAWAFGDGSTSIDKNPVHTYTADGTYTVSLTVVNSFGCTNTVTGDLEVHTNEVDWVLPSTFCEVSATQFTDNSIAATGWAWDFGDGGSATVQNPEHTYTVTGTYTVALTVTNSFGCVASTSQEVTVHGNQVAWTLPSSICENGSVDFADNSATTANRQWSFGDGTTSTDQAPSHSYASDGEFTVTLTVTNAAGCTNMLSEEIEVNPNDIEWSIPEPVCTYVAANFADNSPSATTWAWAFGDGATGTQKTPSHEYTVPGDYTVTLDMENSFGCSNTISKVITVGICVGLEDSFQNDPGILYPNPSNGVLIMKLDWMSKGPGRVEIVNTGGETVFTEVVQETSADTHTFDLRSLSNGYYFVRIQSGNDAFVRKLIINR